MKWSKKGQQFEEFGNYCVNTKCVYLYGAVESAKQIIEHLEFATIKTNKGYCDYEICFVDRDKKKQNSMFLGKKVISPEQFYKEFLKNNGIVVLCMNSVTAKELWEKFENIGIVRRFNAFSAYEFYRYMSLFIYFRYKYTYLHFVDMFIHTYCNLQCEFCCIQNYRGYKRMRSIEQIKNNIDYLFKNVNIVGVFNFGIAEGFMGGETLAEAIKYICENYSEKFMAIEIVTNGTVIPNIQLIEAMKNDKVRIALDDYRENVELARKKFDSVKKCLKENKIKYSELKREYWENYKFGESIDSDVEGDEYKLRDCICHAKGFMYIGYNDNPHRIYSCVHQAINAYHKIIREEDDDSMDLDKCTPLELIEFLLGYTEKGDLSACRYCNGAFENVELMHIPVAQQKEK